jgi:hypothetical protein
VRNIKLSVACIATVLFAQSANAAHYVLNYSGDKTDLSGTLLATLNIDVSNTANAIGGFDVSSVTGTVDGDSVVGIVANPDTPGTHSANGFIFNNILFDANPVFDIYGLAFTTSTVTWNLWGTGPDTYTLMKFLPGRGFSGARGGTLQVTAVPEPGSWAMLVAGFGLVGLATRRRATAVVA